MTTDAVSQLLAGRPKTAEWDLLVAIMGTPYSSDSISTALRWVDAAASCGRVQVWTCGYATLLTQRSLTAAKPRNALDWNRDYVTSMACVREMLFRHPDRLRWLTCQFCSEERGATDHFEMVTLRPALSFGKHVRESAKTVFVGLT